MDLGKEKKELEVQPLEWPVKRQEKREKEPKREPVHVEEEEE